ncbi:endonuclease domain-containing protein [Mycobacterium asiaticum]
MVFRRNEALRRADVTRHELRRWYRPVFPGVYVAAGQQLSLRDRTQAAWLWSQRRWVVAGLAASALHGAQWVDAGTPIELICSNTHPPRGILARKQTLTDAEISCVAGLPVTSVVRTAYDLGRLLTRAEAVARLDALMRATSFSADAVLHLAERYPAARGIRTLRAALDLVDAGAASPRESALRLLLIDAGLPAPRTQIPIVVKYHTLAVLDMGWSEYGVAVEYDGDQHRADRGRYVWDQRRLRKLEDLGWIIIRVIAEDPPDEVVERVKHALLLRGWRAGDAPVRALAG